MIVSITAIIAAIMLVILLFIPCPLKRADFVGNHNDPCDHYIFASSIIYSCVNLLNRVRDNLVTYHYSKSRYLIHQNIEPSARSDEVALTFDNVGLLNDLGVLLSQHGHSRDSLEVFEEALQISALYFWSHSVQYCNCGQFGYHSFVSIGA